MKNKNFGRKRQAIYILSNRKSTRIIKTLMDFFFFIKVKIKMVCFSVPSSPQGGGSGSIGRGLNSMSAARLPPKSATTKIRCLRASLREPAQYWASMSRQHTSGVPPRTIPAFPHLPEGGIGTSVSEKADKTALKSIRSFVENAPMTFSQTAIAGYRLSVASLISCMIRNA